MSVKRAQIARHLWNKLWQDYSRRVNYAQVYQEMISQAGGTVANDHIAFRSLRLTVDSPAGKINLGIDYVASIAEALGYEVAGELSFSEQHLLARHYRHPEQDQFDLPKLFISELIVDDLPEVISEAMPLAQRHEVQAIANLIYQTVSRDVAHLSSFDAEALLSKMETSSTKAEFLRMLEQLRSVFVRPWGVPAQSIVEAVNAVTQYGAWILLHGYAPNHFTGYINRQNTSCYPDIESTAHGLAARGVPMKAEIEGSQASGLRQTATHAVTEMVSVLNDTTGELTSIPWTYAYYEIAERMEVEVAPGQKALFEGFLGPSAKNLFDMTRKAS